MNFADAHNHIQDARLRNHRSDIVSAWKQSGGSRMVVNGTSEKDWAEVAFLAREFSFVIPSFGLHPWYVMNASLLWRDAWLSFMDACPCAVGEIGLDCWIPDHDLAAQKEAFVFQLETAAARNLPVTIHCLKAWAPLLEILNASILPGRGFLLHSYSGSPELVSSLVKLGAYFSISGYFAHERKEASRRAFETVPLDRLLVETDAPDMLGPPRCVPMELWDVGTGKLLNHPANLPAIYAFAAELRQIPLIDFTRQITENFERFFWP